MSEIAQWLPWTILSAAFAALTAIFAKIGVQHIDSTAATLIRTVIIGVILLAIVLARDSLPPLNGVSARTYALVLSGLATGASCDPRCNHGCGFSRRTALDVELGRRRCDFGRPAHGSYDLMQGER